MKVSRWQALLVRRTTALVPTLLALLAVIVGLSLDLSAIVIAISAVAILVISSLVRQHRSGSRVRRRLLSAQELDLWAPPVKLDGPIRRLSSEPIAPPFKRTGIKVGDEFRHVKNGDLFVVEQMKLKPLPFTGMAWVVFLRSIAGGEHLSMMETELRDSADYEAVDRA